MDPQRYHSGVPSASGSNQKRDWRKWSLVPTNQFENLKQPMIEAAASDTHRCQRANNDQSAAKMCKSALDNDNHRLWFTYTVLLQPVKCSTNVDEPTANRASNSAQVSRCFDEAVKIQSCLYLLMCWCKHGIFPAFELNVAHQIPFSNARSRSHSSNSNSMDHINDQYEASFRTHYTCLFGAPFQLT